MRPTKPFVVLAAWIALAFTPTLSTQAAETGSITGTVSNIATGKLLEGAKVDVPQLGLTTLADQSGRFVLSGLPAGAHEIVVSYLGLDTVRSPVSLAPGERAVRDFPLTTGIYKLDAFKVTGEREGDAAAITAQRNSLNVKNVVAMDSFGNLPNMSAGEVIMRLPGVAGSPTEEGLNYQFNIRGMGAGLNTVTMDGARLPSLGFSRAFENQSITSGMFDQLELIKGHTPDKSAESLGGTINFKSRSALTMKEKRRITYNFSARIAPSFTQQIPYREQHRAHPVMNFSYQELFGVFGEERNLGVSVNLFYSENAVGFFRTDRDFQNTTTQPAYVWSYQTQDNYNNRKQQSLSVKADYRLSASTKLTLSGVTNDNKELSRIRWRTRAFTGTQNQNFVPNGTTSSIVPGFTDRITEVRAVPTSTINMQMIGPNHYMVRMRRVDLTVEQEFGPLQLNYSARFARTNLNNGSGAGGDLTNQITNVGWILDRTQSDLYPRFIQTAGPDFTNPANWRPVTSAPALVRAQNQNDQRIRELNGDARYALSTQLRTILRTGVQWRETLAKSTGGGNRYNYVGTGPLAHNPDRIMFDQIKTGRRIPQWDTTWHLSKHKLTSPELWTDDVYWREQVKHSGTRHAFETVTAGYLMAQGKFSREGWLGRTGYLGGVRTEKTDTNGFGWVLARASTRSTAAERAADPIAAVTRDYTRRETKGSYTKSFPSAHLTHDITPNLKGRVSWSTSFGRPAMSNFLPGESANENAQTVSINNPSLLPQTAVNWDATLDYSFEPVGNVSVGWFKKTIKDFIVDGINTGTVGTGTDNGFNGDYAGFARFQSLNAGTAFVEGWEISYQQQFTFLPGLLKGLSGTANYTVLNTRGDFGGTTNLSTGQVQGFIPRAVNLMLAWRYRSFSTRVLYNYTSDYIVSYSAATLGRNSYRFALKTVNVGVAYQLRPSLSLTLDVSNLFNAPQVLYRGVRSQMQTTIINGTTINAGVSGRF